MKYRMKKLLAMMMAILMVLQMTPITVFAQTIPLSFKNSGDFSDENPANYYVSIELPEGFSTDAGSLYFVVAGDLNHGFKSIPLSKVQTTGNGIYGYHLNDTSDVLVLLKRLDENGYNPGDENTDKGDVVVSNWNQVYSAYFDNDHYQADLPLDSSSGMYSVMIQKVDSTASNDYSYRSILGNGVYYGITADEFWQQNHLQTNLATNKFWTSCDSEVKPNLSGNSAGLIYAGYIVKDPNSNRDKMKVDCADSKEGAQIIVYTENDDKVFKTGGSTTDQENKIHVFKESASTIKKSIVDPIINHAATVSAAMATHSQTSGVVATVSGNNCYLDTTSLPNNVTIYIDADQYANQIKVTGGLEITKNKDQVIIFNFKNENTTSVWVDKFIVKYPGDTQGQDSSSDTSQTTSNVSKDEIARTICWNFAGGNIADVTLNIACGMFIAPHSNVTSVNTSTGWVISGKRYSNQNGEWHFIYVYQPSVESATLLVRKTIQNVNATSSQKFDFTVSHFEKENDVWKFVPKGSTQNDGGTVEFTNVYCELGWNVFEIKETMTDWGEYVPLDKVYYAAVKKSQTKDGRFAVTQARYFESFNQDIYKEHRDDAAATCESIGLSNEYTSGTPVFNNTKGEAKGKLQIVKSVTVNGEPAKDSELTKDLADGDYLFYVYSDEELKTKARR